jgi:small subunit ribosomal protein S19e
VTKVFDVPAADLIEEMAKEFEKNPQAQQPVFAPFVKTGPHRERAPQRTDWWYVRLASILYRAYKNGPVGTEQLRTYYGGRQARGVKPAHFRKSGGKIIRLGLQTLEKMGLIKKAKKGRIVSPQGEKFLTEKAKTALNGLEEKRRLAKEMAIERERKRKEREAKEKAMTGQQQRPQAKGKEKEKKPEKKAGP